MASAKKARTSALWSDNPAPTDQHATNHNAPSEKKRESSGAMRRFVVYGLFCLAALAVVLQIGNIANTAANKPEPVTVDSLSINSSIGKPAATTTLIEWLRAEPAPLPGGTIVSWDGYKSIAAGEKTAATSQAADASELHYFTLSVPTADGNIYYTSTVLVSVDKALGAKVQGTPTILPKAPSAQDGWSTSLWPGYDSVQATDAVTDAVIVWSKAFTDTPAALRLAVGDQGSSRSYIPLSGATVVASDVTAAGAVKSTDGSKPTTLIVRVQLKLNWTSDEESASPSLVTYDLLVTEADTAAPRVVAWGGAGTGPSLVKYQNAVAGDVKTVSPSTVPSPVPTPTSTTGGQD